MIHVFLLPLLYNKKEIITVFFMRKSGHNILIWTTQHFYFNYFGSINMSSVTSTKGFMFSILFGLLAGLRKISWDNFIEMWQKGFDGGGGGGGRFSTFCFKELKQRNISVRVCNLLQLDLVWGNIMCRSSFLGWASYLWQDEAWALKTMQVKCGVIF